ncbi:hypothetical protein B0H66DRAFT_529131 [Apodospora peruviana]|uniref:RING-type domain-containing protein n=1 Tax=Apodospora peruviana TaxID=516989 RepID=A0AAE0IHF0_9PEZI|nr:hypothetical protein B0H66DRAFT_529131 [Apodospora peruviana]
MNSRKRDRSESPDSQDNPTNNSNPAAAPYIQSRIIPQLLSNGKHNYGNHQQHLSIPLGARIVSGVNCIVCKRGDWYRAALHILPCGHALCLDCLEDKVDTICTLIHLDHAAIAEQGKGMVCRHECSSTQQPNDVRAPSVRAQVFDLIELGCCVQDMQLEKFASCMSPDASTMLWHYLHLLEHPPSRVGSLRVGRLP